MTRDSKTTLTTLRSLLALLKMLSPGQKIALSSLYELINSLDQLKSFNFLPALHNLLISIICHEIPHEQKLACATDYSLCIGSLLPNGCFQQANGLTQNCAALQHTFLVTLFHDSRLQFFKVPEFVLYNQSHWLGINLDKLLRTLWGSDKEEMGEDEELGDIADEIEDNMKESESESVEESVLGPMKASGRLLRITNCSVL